MCTKTRHVFGTRLALILVLLIVEVIGAIPAKPVLAATFTVTNTNDIGVGSLRQAIFDAPSGSTITFDPSLAGQTIALSVQLTIDKDLTIDGSGLSSQVVLSGNNVSRIMRITFLAANVTISDLTFTKGLSADFGGAIYMNSSTQLTLNNTTFSQNHSSSSGGAIAIRGSGSLTLSNSTLYQNQTSGSGGAVYLEGFGPIIAMNSIMTENQAGSGGGAIFAFAAALALTDSTLSKNTSGDSGGAIVASRLTFKNTTIDRNQASSDGGAMYIAGNGSSTIVNSTIFQNQAGASGGAIIAFGNLSMDISNSTFAANTAAEGKEVKLSGVTALNLHNTVFVCTTGSDNCYVRLTNAAILTDHSILGVGSLDDYGLAELADNGGATQTMALLPESPLIDAGDDSVCANATVGNLDQRGVSRLQGTHCDIGAYEDQLIVRYVKQGATGANDGTSWPNAYTDLQSALAAASPDYEIWVAAGTYKPTSGTDRIISFTLKNGVALYGGFAGTEALVSQRDYETNVTVLSGDIGSVGDNSDNSYHVLVGSNTNNSTILDGFTITAGNANGISVAHNGGGMYNTNGHPTLSNIIFTDNSATWGGGMYNESDSYPTLTNVTLHGNTTASTTIEPPSGGGIFNTASSPILTNVTFQANSAEYGGGMFNQLSSSPILVNVTFNSNSASFGGAMIIRDANSSPTLTHVTLANNSASSGGGAIANAGTTVIRNSILWGNSGGEIFNLIGQGVASVSNSIVQGGYPGTGNLDANPLLGPLQDNGGFTQTIALLPGSPAINAGDDTNCPATDQRGVTRPQGSHCDMGAYEYQKKNGNDTTGVFRPTNGALYLKNKNETGFADVQINYGLGGDYPIVGDWDGDGDVTIGIYRNGSFYLRNSNTIGFADVVFPFGMPGDQPIAGDWDGDGVDTIGVYRNGTFYLRNSNRAGAAEMSFALGIAGDVGIAGDWNGDSSDTTGVFRPSNGALYLKNTNATGFADVQINYGLPGDKPVTGDWNDDGVDTIGVYRNGQFMLRNSNTIGFAEIVFGLGIPGDMPIAGNWDGQP